MFRKIAEYTPFPAITGHFDLLLPKRLSSQYTCQASVKSFAPEKCKECERHFFIYLLLDIGCPIHYCPFIDIGIGMIEFRINLPKYSVIHAYTYRHRIGTQVHIF